MRVTKVYEGTDPGATPGRVFTASVGQEEIIKQGAFLDSLSFGMKGAVSTGAVAIEAFAGVLSAYTLRVGPETRILMNLRQMCAFMKFWYGELPFIWENTDNTGNDFLGGIRIPIKAPAEDGKPITHTADRTAVTNIATETLAINAYWEDATPDSKPIHAVRIAHTTAGSAGYETLDFGIAPLGKMVGLIIEQTNVFADANIDVSVQRIKILVDGVEHSQLNSLSDGYGWAGVSVGILDPMDDLLNIYTKFDFRPSGIDTKAGRVTIQVDVQDVSDAIVLIPIIEME